MNSISRTELIRRLRKLGFEGPYSGGRHSFMKRGSLKLRIANPHEGMAYQELANTITINILDFNYIKQTRNYHSVFRLFEKDEGFELTEALEISHSSRQLIENKLI